MAIIEKGVALPVTNRVAVNHKLSPLAEEILEALKLADVSDSFVVAGEYKRVALIAGRMAARVGCGIKTATEAEGQTRIWKIEAKAKGAKRTKAVKAA